MIEMHPHLEYVSPVLALVIQSLVKHLHDLNEVIPIIYRPSGLLSAVNEEQSIYELVVSHLSDFVHLSTRRTPWIIRCSIANFGLDV